MVPIVFSEKECPGERLSTALRKHRLPPIYTLGYAFGDSITDGHASTTDGNDRWPDELARRLQASPDKRQRDVAVVNEGIGGNHLLTNGLGESALERLDRDVLAVSDLALNQESPALFLKTQPSGRPRRCSSESS